MNVSITVKTLKEDRRIAATPEGIMAFPNVLMARDSTALEALGASGHQLQHAIMLNSTAVIGCGAVAVATWQVGINGMVLARHVVEAATPGLASFMLLHLTGPRDRGRTAPTVRGHEEASPS
ncbi:MAG: hypothetical protein NT037_02030 [Hyphomicrobiales bacterium]|nr:hypothetical protein [Hyphomicrobiales bacterium]